MKIQCYNCKKFFDSKKIHLEIAEGEIMFALVPYCDKCIKLPDKSTR